MITGFNTDVKHNTKVYHVQTEDKGRDNPKIESLVYVGGEILDDYRTSYDQTRSELTEEEIMALLEAQHKRVIRAIKVGKYDKDSPFENNLISDQSLDELIAEYLSKEPVSDYLKLITHGMVNLMRDRSAKLQIESKKAVSNESVEGVYVRVKLVGLEVKVLAQGTTNKDGAVILPVKLPVQVPGEVHELMIQAISEYGTAEQKYPLHES